MVILEENFKWHLEAFASELFICHLFMILKSKCGEVRKQSKKEEKRDNVKEGGNKKGRLESESRKRKRRKMREKYMSETGNGCPIVLRGGSGNFMCPSFCFRCKNKLLGHKDKGDFFGKW